MLHLKKMGPKTASTQASAASKIKNKIHSLSFHSFQDISVFSAFSILMLCTLQSDTSSFFKVSLKANNRALAQALEFQKKRCRQLEMEIMHFQKQVEALCFELASKKYKQRKLVGLFKFIYRCYCR